VECVNLPVQATLRDYLEEVLKPRPQCSERGWIFRGHRELCWKLAPKIDRQEFTKNRSQSWTRKQQEARLVGDFETGARPHVRIEPRDHWEWLAVAQHHGLATRLLDWTSNPLVALYFAVEEEESMGDSVVWCYHHQGYDWSKFNKKGPLLVSSVVEFRPPHITPRITAQGGCFTVHPDLKPNTLPWRGPRRRIRIPKGVRHNFRNELRRLGVDRATLFPDLDGIAFALNRHISEHVQ
jgi:hypothetical protein